MIARLKAAVAAFCNPSPVLTSADGKFSCVPGHAVEIAYMLSNAEAALWERDMDRFDMGELLADYLDGRSSLEEINDQLREFREERLEREQRRKCEPLAPVLTLSEYAAKMNDGDLAVALANGMTAKSTLFQEMRP